MTDKTIVLPQKARIIKRNGKPREVILPIKEYKALQSLIEDLKDSLEIQRAKNEIRAGKDTLLFYREVRKSLRYSFPADRGIARTGPQTGRQDD